MGSPLYSRQNGLTVYGCVSLVPPSLVDSFVFTVEVSAADEIVELASPRFISATYVASAMIWSVWASSGFHMPSSRIFTYSCVIFDANFSLVRLGLSPRFQSCFMDTILSSKALHGVSCTPTKNIYDELVIMIRARDFQFDAEAFGFQLWEPLNDVEIELPSLSSLSLESRDLIEDIYLNVWVDLLKNEKKGDWTIFDGFARVRILPSVRMFPDCDYCSRFDRKESKIMTS